MTLDSLYQISDLKITDDTFEADININADHDVFKGHFPDKKVLPGVCLLRIVKDLAGKIADKELMLKEAKNVKFLHIIDPDVHRNIQIKGSFTLSDNNTYTLITKALYGEINFFTFKGDFVIFAHKQP